MSVDYDAFLGIGKRFSDKDEAVNYIITNTYLEEPQIEAMIDGGTHLGMCVVCLDSYSGQDWFVGFEIGCDTYASLSYHVVDAHERWKAMFPKSDPRVVHAVKIW